MTKSQKYTTAKLDDARYEQKNTIYSTTHGDNLSGMRAFKRSNDNYRLNV